MFGGEDAYGEWNRVALGYDTDLARTSDSGFRVEHPARNTTARRTVVTPDFGLVCACIPLFDENLKLIAIASQNLAG